MNPFPNQFKEDKNIYEFNDGMKVNDFINSIMYKILSDDCIYDHDYLLKIKRNNNIIKLEKYYEDLDFKNKLIKLFHNYIKNEMKIINPKITFIKIDFSRVYINNEVVPTEFIKKFLAYGYHFSFKDINVTRNIEKNRFKNYNRIVILYNNLPTGVLRNQDDIIQLIDLTKMSIYGKEKPDYLCDTIKIK